MPGLDELRALKPLQQPEWPDPAALNQVIAELRTLPPLVFAGECDDLTTKIGAVARGEAARVIGEAQAQASQRLAQATGAASAFTALAAEHKRAPRLTEDRLYLETAERVLPGARKIVRSTAGTARGYELWLRGNGTPTVFPPPPGSPGSSSAPSVPSPPAILPQQEEGLR